jgi:hypothetical protein
MRRLRPWALRAALIGAATAAIVAVSYSELPSSAAAEAITTEGVVDAGVDDVVELPPVLEDAISGLDAPLDRKQ